MYNLLFEQHIDVECIAYGFSLLFIGASNYFFVHTFNFLNTEQRAKNARRWQKLHLTLSNSATGSRVYGPKDRVNRHCRNFCPSTRIDILFGLQIAKTGITLLTVFCFLVFL